ncbi:MAG: hypothetical protein HKP09_05755 [Enterobacterales bacterium]|nr:hypothetical protein [Enterobacterales bacterium]
MPTKHSNSDNNLQFIENRRRLIDAWRWAGSLSLLGLLAFILWLWYSNPILINPFGTIAAIESGSMPDTSMVIMAAMLPVIFILTLFLILLLLVLVTVSLNNEKRYMSIIDTLSDNDKV